MTLRPPYKPITAELYRQMPEGPPYYQLIEGNLIMSPSPNFFHQQLVSRPLRYIGNYLEDRPLGVVNVAPSDVFLDEINVFQPDIYYVSNERRNVIVTEGVRGAPDLVIETLSPSTSARDRNEKRGVYERAGVLEMWLIDPDSHTIEVHSLADETAASLALIKEPDPFLPGMFTGLRIETVRLFQVRPPSV